MKAKVLLVLLASVYLGANSQNIENVAFYLPMENSLVNFIATEVSFNSLAVGTNEANAPHYSEGKFGQSLLFDSTCYIMSAERKPYTSGNYTLTYWFNFTKLSSEVNHEQFVVQQQYGNTTGRAYTTLPVANTLVVYYGGPFYSTTVLEANKWYHIAIVIDRANKTKKVYLNGNKESETTVSGFETNDGQWIFGIDKFYNTSKVMLGGIDDVLLIKEALSTETIDKIISDGVASLFTPTQTNKVENVIGDFRYINNSIYFTTTSNSPEMIVSIFSMNGQKILTRNVRNNASISIDNLHLGKGLYVLKATSETEISTQKFLVK